MPNAPIAKLICAFVALAGVSHAMAGPITDIDQQQTSISHVNPIALTSPLGQSFTPTLNQVDFFTFLMSDITSAAWDVDVQAQIRTSSITGTIIGQSEIITLVDCFNQPVPTPACGIAGGTSTPVTFDFPGGVPVTPGTTYFVRLVEVSSNTGVGVGYAASSHYSGGTMYAHGNLVFNSDLWFKEGIYIPEPTTLALFCVAVALVTRRQRH